MSFTSLDNRTIKILLIILAGVGSISLAGVILLNLPFFYELNTTQSAITFILVSLVMFVLTALSFKAFVFTNLDSFLEKRNLIFIIFLIIFLSIIISISSYYIWTKPEIYAVEICFDADDSSSPLNVQNLTHPVTNRLYPPDSFGLTRYPMTIESGTCVNGQITTLLGRHLRYVRGAHLAVTFRGDPPAGRFFISINDSPSVVMFEENGEQSVEDTIGITNGFQLGSPWVSSLDRYGFYGLRLAMIGFGAIILSLFLFGFTDRTISFTPGDIK